MLPFKPQNMSNNAAVTEDGGEIGRAQALQARAAARPPSVHMNPVLLKPQSEIGAQVVVQGRVYGRASAAEYQQIKPELMPFVLDSFARLKADADIVLVEGAGSASEINLRANDIANMGFARAADVPVVLIGDIDRGGVIASLVGTKAVIEAEDAALIGGFLVNKFRGDPALFADGMALIAAATGWEALGLVPFFPEARLLPAEDALALDRRPAGKAGRAASRSRCRSCRISPISTISTRSTPSPRSISCACVPAVRCPAMPTSSSCRARRRPSPISPRCARRASTSTSPRICAAAAWCSACAAAIRCSAAPSTIRTASKGRAAQRQGLGLLDVETTLSAEKRLEPAQGATADGVPFTGYEMHMGVTEGPICARPFARLADGSPEGAMSADGRVIGTYIHGLFADDRQRSAWLERFASGGAAVRLRCPDRGDARQARRASRRAYRYRPAAQTSAMSAASTNTMAMSRPSARR